MSKALDGRLGTVPILEGWGLAEETPLRGRLGIEGVTFVDGDDLQLPLRRPLVLGGLVEFVDPSLGVDGRDALADLLRAERAIFVIEAVTGAVGRGDIELHEMDVLAQNIGRCAHLEIVHLVVIRHQVGVPVFDRVVGIRSEEEGLRRPDARHGRRHVIPEGEEPLLGEVPPFLVEHHVELEDGRLVSADVDIRFAVAADTGRGIRRSRGRRAGRSG